MSIRLIVFSSLLLIGPHNIFASEAGPSSTTTTDRGKCTICLDTMNDGQELVDGHDLFGCISKDMHIFHQDCIQRWQDEHNTCPVCRASKDPNMVAEQEAALMADYSAHYPAPWAAPTEPVPTPLTPLQIAQTTLADMPVPAGVRPGIWRRVQIDLNSVDDGDYNLMLSGLHITSSEFESIINALPLAIKELISEIDVDHNQLTTLPDSIGHLTALQEFNASYNQLTMVPDSIGHLTALQHLSITHNQLTTLPDSIGHLTALQILGLSENQLTILPDSIGRLSSLLILELYYNQLTILPDAMEHLTALKILGLSNNQLAILPDWIGQFPDLQQLRLASNRLTMIPNSIGHLTALKVLTVGENRLTILPDTIGHLTALQELWISENQLTTLPDALGNLTALQTLSTAKNKLTRLPDSIDRLPVLQILHVDRRVTMPTLRPEVEVALI